MSALLVIMVAFSGSALAQKKAKVVKLEQTPGEFDQEEITLKAGTYVFEVTNKGVDHEVGFVLVPAGADASDAANHIKEAYLAKTINDGETAKSNEVVLAKGEYNFFCPLNTTPHYTLVVK